MNTLFITVFLFSFMGSSVFAFTINSLLNVVQCQPSLLTWSGGVPPYYVSVLTDPGAPPIVNFGEQNGTSLTWIVNITAGVSAFLELRDNTGATVESANFTVQAGLSTCNTTGTPGNSLFAAGATSTLASGSAGNTVAGASTGMGMGSSSTAALEGTSSTSTGATSSPSLTSAASHYAPVGTLAMAGAAALAFALVL